MLVNGGEMLVNDGEMSVWTYTHFTIWQSLRSCTDCNTEGKKTKFVGAIHKKKEFDVLYIGTKVKIKKI